MNVQPYPSYQPSGVEWFGSIPIHWKIRSLNRIARINAKVLPENTDADFTFHYLDIGSVGTGVLLSQPKMLRFGDAPSRARRVVSRHDTLISTVRTYLKAVYHIKEDVENLIASTGFAVLTPGADVVPSYLRFLMESEPFTANVTAHSIGIAYPAIAESVLASLKVPLPPLNEQAAIVRYLDAVDRAIRRYIRAKRRLIALLNEQKQAIIHQAVTQGLDPSAPRKPSGVDWLGEIPAHWEIIRLKYLFREVDERSLNGLEILLSLRMYQGLVPHNDVSTIPIGPANLIGYKIVQPGYLVMNRMRAALGMFGIAPQVGIVSPDYAVFRTIRDVETDYYLYLFQTNTMRRLFRIESKGLGTGASGFLRLYSDRFGQIHVPLPPRPEQTAILAHIAQVTRQLSQAIDKTQHEIDLIREYRTRLIADVVTGKIDVRQLTPPDLTNTSLPDELVDATLDTLDADVEEEDEALEADGLACEDKDLRFDPHEFEEAEEILSIYH